MADVIISDIPDDVLDRIDAAAEGVGLTRAQYLRQHLDELGAGEAASVTLGDLDRFANHFTDLRDEEVLRDAWR